MRFIPITSLFALTLFLGGCVWVPQQSSPKSSTDDGGKKTQIVTTTYTYQKEREEYVKALMNTSTWRVFVDKEYGIQFKYPAIFTRIEKIKGVPFYILKIENDIRGKTISYNFMTEARSLAVASCKEPGYNESYMSFCTMENYNGVQLNDAVQDIGDTPFAVHDLIFSNPQSDSRYKFININFDSTIDEDYLNSDLGEDAFTNPKIRAEAIGFSITERKYNNHDLDFIHAIIDSFRISVQ